MVLSLCMYMTFSLIQRYSIVYSCLLWRIYIQDSCGKTGWLLYISIMGSCSQLFYFILFFSPKIESSEEMNRLFTLLHSVALMPCLE